MAKDTTTWTFVVEHTCTQRTSFEAAREKLAKFAKTSGYQVEVAPLSPDKPNVVLVHIMGVKVIFGVVFEDRGAVGSVTAPNSMAWVEPMVRTQLEKEIRKILTEAGSTSVEITYL